MSRPLPQALPPGAHRVPAAWAHHQARRRREQAAQRRAEERIQRDLKRMHGQQRWIAASGLVLFGLSLIWVLGAG
jgi:hypothetical protein